MLPQRLREGARRNYDFNVGAQYYRLSGLSSTKYMMPATLLQEVRNPSCDDLRFARTRARYELQVLNRHG